MLHLIGIVTIGKHVFACADGLLDVVWCRYTPTSSAMMWLCYWHRWLERDTRAC